MYNTKNNNVAYENLINILYIEEQDENKDIPKNHFVYIKNFDGLLKK